MHMFVDTQSPAETKGIVEGSQDLTFLGRIAATSREDRAAMADALYSVGKITKKQIEKLSELRPGEFFIIENMEDAKKRRIFLPRTLFWKERYSNFNNVWKNFIDKWMLIEEDKKNIIENFKQRTNKIEHDNIFKEMIKKEVESKNINKEEIKEIKIKEEIEKIPNQNNAGDEFLVDIT